MLTVSVINRAQALDEKSFMSRSTRLFDLIQALRRYRRPVSGRLLADELNVSLRTIYRDIQTLIGQGAAIDGEAGIGFVLRPGFVLPPLIFSDDELEALVLGSRWVARQQDDPLARAAATAPAHRRQTELGLCIPLWSYGNLRGRF